MFFFINSDEILKLDAIFLKEQLEEVLHGQLMLAVDNPTSASVLFRKTTFIT